MTKCFAARMLIKPHFKHLLVFKQSTNGLVCAYENVFLIDHKFTVTDSLFKFYLIPDKTIFTQVMKCMKCSKDGENDASLKGSEI